VLKITLAQALGELGEEAIRNFNILHAKQLRTPSLDYYKNVLLILTGTSYYIPASTLALSIVCARRGYVP
jgi:hypothetical protein